MQFRRRKLQKKNQRLNSAFSASSFQVQWFLMKDSINRLAAAIMNELKSTKMESFDNQAVCAWLSGSSLLNEFVLHLK